jgi:hypothetical protein
VKRSDGAKSWSRVLSELAQVKVSVEWERPTWRVSWQDGPTRKALMGRAAALGGYRAQFSRTWPRPQGTARRSEVSSGRRTGLARSAWPTRSPPTGCASRQSLEVYSRIALADAQQRYEQVIDCFPV